MKTVLILCVFMVFIPLAASGQGGHIIVCDNEWGLADCDVSNSGGCIVSPVEALVVNYLGTSHPCDVIKVVPDPRANPPGIYVTDCATPEPNVYTLRGHATYINNNGTCYGGYPVEATTWGKVKVLYR